MGSNVDIKNLSPEERLTLLGDIWDSLDPEVIPVTEAQRAELDRRLDEFERDRNLGIPWEEVLRQIRNRSK
ncbi:MAG: addiction module protein [Planctomycetota bacterium]